MFHCPNCGIELSLTLATAKREDKGSLDSPVKNQMTSKERIATFQIDRVRYTLSDQDIFDAAASLSYPETTRRYYVELPDKKDEIRRFPIKQVVRKALRTKYSEKFVENNFTAHRARDILLKLGFTVEMTY